MQVENDLLLTVKTHKIMKIDVKTLGRENVFIDRKLRVYFKRFYIFGS